MGRFHFKIRPVLICAGLIALLGCGGPRINSKPQQLHDRGPMIAVANQHIKLTLQNILIKNSPGSWAKDANWDEYIFSLTKLDSIDTVTLQAVYIEDIMGDRHLYQNTRKDLNQSTKVLKKKYKKAGYKVRFGAGSTHASAVGISFALGSGVTAGAVTATGSIGTLTSAGVGVAVAVPALVISGITKIVYNTRVNNRIQERQTLPPIVITTDGHEVDLMFPATPLPQKLVVSYLYQELLHELEIDLTQVTTGLHIKQQQT